ncbi:protein kinase [Pseudanabaena sp. FACHB-1998]|uniref:serine/threonine protein kinase n=1 Tax=Pseudanabaena sp. FACHB-1998 TaxID=2692858 RepID=UPI00168095B3|nr:serine/threonine-protein kinase [Pseudanabaena sp. FACHB-1998]MBD2177427.1 protein kinase [Pseudanabaena sp. FACHB-1998]
MLEPQAIINKRYQLERQLGQNAGRETWLAKDLQQGHERVVVKLLAFGGNIQWEDLKLFEREANVLKQLDHPRIPKYRDYFSIDDRSLWFGLVQEYIQGESLKEYLAKGHKFTESQVKQMAIAILEILRYLHELNPQVLHRDIKPSNLILTGRDGETRNIYLVDFGAVQDRASAEGKSFTIVGTYGYAPMEQYGGRAVAASDLYALGATMIHLLTGISPADLPQDDDAKIVFRDRTSASLHLVQWIQKLVEPTVKKRYATAREALQTLQEPVALAPQAISKPVTQSVPKSRPKRRVYPPDQTNIQVEQSPTQLRIVIPCSIWMVIVSWGLVIGVILFLQPFFPDMVSVIAILKNYVWTYILTALLVVIMILLTINQLTSVILEIGEQETWLRRSLFGKIYWKATFPTHELNGVVPKWNMIEKRDSSFISWLMWAGSEHSEDNSIKSNVVLQLRNTEYTLAISKIRPTEVNWLIDVIEEFLYSNKS